MDAIWWALVGITIFLFAVALVLGMRYEKYRKEMLKATPKYKIAAWMASCVLFVIAVILLYITNSLPEEISRYALEILWVALPLFIIAFYLIFLRPFHKKNEHL